MNNQEQKRCIAKAGALKGVNLHSWQIDAIAKHLKQSGFSFTQPEVIITHIPYNYKLLLL